MKNRMKYGLILLFAPLLLWAPSYAQDPAVGRVIRDKADKYIADQSAMERAASSSASARALHYRLSKISSESDFTRALDNVVSSGDKSVIPYLKARLDADHSGKNEIEVALVRLGETEYFDRAVEELSSRDVTIQNVAIWKLSMFKTKEAYRKLYELLDDESVRDVDGHGDYVVPSLAFMVKDRLASTVQSPPIGGYKYSTTAWKAWFEKNRHLIN